jgi:hypothetical protein
VMASLFLLWRRPRVRVDDIWFSGSGGRDGGRRRSGATEVPEAAGAEAVRQALVEETEEGGGRECSGSAGTRRVQTGGREAARLSIGRRPEEALGRAMASSFLLWWRPSVRPTTFGSQAATAKAHEGGGWEQRRHQRRLGRRRLQDNKCSGRTRGVRA